MHNYTTDPSEELPAPLWLKILFWLSVAWLFLPAFTNAQNADSLKLGVGVEFDVPVHMNYKNIDAVSAAWLQASWDSTHFDFISATLAPQWDSLGFSIVENLQDTSAGRYTVAMASVDTLACDTLMMTLRLRTTQGNFANGIIAFSGKFNEADSVYSQMTYYIVDETLPVELTRFHANISSNHARIRWDTKSETNNARFDVYSVHYFWETDGRYWPGIRTYLGHKDGQGTTTETHKYSLSANMEPGIYRFMIRQIDFDGRYEEYWSDYYEVLMHDASLSVYPVPANPNVTITYVAPNVQEVSIKIYNILGQLVTTVYEDWVNGRHQWHQDMSSFGSGMYFVVSETPNARIVRTFTVLK